MSETTALKAYFNPKSVQMLGEEVRSVYAAFDLKGFQSGIEKELESLELKDRVKLIAAAYRRHLPDPYPEAVDILVRSLGPPLPNAKDIDGMATSMLYWPVAQFIELYGLDHLEPSIRAMHAITQRFTAEWAIRPFIVKYPGRMLSLLEEWTKDESMHVRRLVSEGSRTRLPWGMRLNQFIKDPTPVRPFLEALKDDPSLYVRRSVANHLNDLTKDNPDWALSVMESWAEGASKDRMWVISHALRGLIKAGNPRALALLGFGEAKVSLSGIQVHPQSLVFGNYLNIDFTLESTGKTDQNLMIDYIIHFVKANGDTSPKVFKLAKKAIAAGESLVLSKRHSIKPVTTRKYYPGTHKVELQVNGKVLGGVEFELVMP